MLSITTRNSTGQFLKHRSLIGTFGTQVLIAASLVVIERVASYAIENSLAWGQKKYTEWVDSKASKIEAKIESQLADNLWDEYHAKMQKEG